MTMLFAWQLQPTVANVEILHTLIKQFVAEVIRILIYLTTGVFEH